MATILQKINEIESEVSFPLCSIISAHLYYVGLFNNAIISSYKFVYQKLWEGFIVTGTNDLMCIKTIKLGKKLNGYCQI